MRDSILHLFHSTDFHNRRTGPEVAEFCAGRAGPREVSTAGEFPGCLVPRGGWEFSPYTLELVYRRVCS